MTHTTISHTLFLSTSLHSTGKKVKIAGSPTKTPGKDKGSSEEGKSSTAKKGPRPLTASAKKKKLEGLKEKVLPSLYLYIYNTH